MAKRGRPAHPDILTPREWEVLEHIQEGLSNEQIAGRLGISVQGVKFHVTEILSKLNLDNRADAARWAASGAPRPWWLSAATPFAFLGKLRPAWLSPVLGGGLGVAVAAGTGVLIWALIAAGGNGERTAAPLALPAGDKIAYVSTDGDLWLLDAGGSRRRLTDEGDVSGPRWSPDGSRILFSRAPLGENVIAVDPPRSLWIIEVETGVQRKVADDVGEGETGWSPDGHRIAYLSPTGYDPGGALWIAGLDGETQEIVPRDFGVDGFAWSPDGERLAVARAQRPIFPEPPEEPSAETIEFPPDNGIYLVDVGGGEPEPLLLMAEIAAMEGGQEVPLMEMAYGVERLRWSPGGRYLIFQPAMLPTSLMADGVPLFSVAIEDGTIAYHGVMLRSWSLLDWAPDGDTLAITHGGGRVISRGKTVAVVQPGVPGATVLGEDPARYGTPQAGNATPISARSDAAPAWSPDGTRIAFQASEAAALLNLSSLGKIEGPREGIWVMDANGTDPRLLTSGSRYLDFQPQWSADGESILFIRIDGEPQQSGVTPQPDGFAGLWIMRPDGSEAEPLITNLPRISSYYGLFRWDSLVAWYQAGQ